MSTQVVGRKKIPLCPYTPFQQVGRSGLPGGCGHRRHTMTLTPLAGRKEETPEFTNWKAIFKHGPSLIADGQMLTLCPGGIYIPQN